MSNYLVRDIMSKRVITLAEKDTLLDAYKLMQRYNLNRLVIVNEDYKPIGIITSKDLVEFLLEDTSGRALDDVILSEVMSRNPIRVAPTYPVPEVASLMLKNRISSIIVIDDNGRLTGIVTKTDLCRFYSHFEGLNLVKDYMTSPVITVRPYDSVFKAALLMMSKDISRLVVVEKRKVMGIITLTDLTLVAPLLKGMRSVPRKTLRKLFTKGIAVTVADLMTSDPITIYEEEDLAIAAKLMIAHSISGLPVLDVREELTGIVTKTDIVKAVSEMRR